jgi:N6-L-threonylcarbamoyladenine synthase
VTGSYILGIESSCDETAAAVVRSGEKIISNVVFSQISTHLPYGGVVPELASREHLRAIVPVVRKALADAQQTYQSVDALAVTQGPGLAGSLLVGISYSKALAFALNKPLIAVNHLEGHIHAVLLEERQRGNHELNFPVLALVVSGGTLISISRRSGAQDGLTRTSGILATTPPAKLSTKLPSYLHLAIPEARSLIASPLLEIQSL